jgi:hypothetical protein
MRSRIRFLALIVLVSIALTGVGARELSQPANRQPSPGTKLEGRWRVVFTLSGLEKHLLFEARAKGAGLLSLLDTGPGDTAATGSLPAAWSQLDNDRVSFSGEAELPLGTCCRELGTVIFKGKFTSPNAIAGKVIFVTSVDEDESPYKFHSAVGTFTATRDPN